MQPVSLLAIIQPAAKRPETFPLNLQNDLDCAEVLPLGGATQPRSGT